MNKKVAGIGPFLKDTITVQSQVKISLYNEVSTYLQVSSTDAYLGRSRVKNKGLRQSNSIF